MRAAIYRRYGVRDEVVVDHVSEPVPLGDEVLVRVAAAALNPKDVYVRRGLYRALSGSRFPRTIGYDFAGTIVARGPRSDAPLGASVFGMVSDWSGQRGTCAELVRVRRGEWTIAPEAVTARESAALPLVCLTALQALRDTGGLSDSRPRGPRPRVCIIGASGGVGAHAIQIARALGAQITTVSSERNRDLCRALGADLALDYERDAIFAHAHYDVVFDAFGRARWDDAKRALGMTGVFVSTVPTRQLLMAATRTIAARTIVPRPAARLVIVRDSTRDLATIRAWVDGGQLRPVIDQHIPLERIGDGMTRLESMRARGKIVVDIATNGDTTRSSRDSN